MIESHDVDEIEYSLVLDELRHFEARVAPIGNDEVVLVVRDISERKGHEIELQQLHDQLEARLDDLQRERELVQAVVESAPSYFCLVDIEGRIRRFNRALELASGCGEDSGTREPLLLGRVHRRGGHAARARRHPRGRPFRRGVGRAGGSVALPRTAPAWTSPGRSPRSPRTGEATRC